MTVGLSALVLFVYTIAQFGLCWVIADSKITRPFREWLDWRGGVAASFILALLECTPCTGFHVGWITAACWLPDVGITGSTLIGASIVAGCYTAGINFIIGRATHLID